MIFAKIRALGGFRREPEEKIGEHSKLEDPAMERLIARISDANFPLRPTHTPTDEYRGSDSMQITAVIDGHKITFLRTRRVESINLGCFFMTDLFKRISNQTNEEFENPE